MQHNKGPVLSDVIERIIATDGPPVKCGVYICKL